MKLKANFTSAVIVCSLTALTFAASPSPSSGSGSSSGPADFEQPQSATRTGLSFGVNTGIGIVGNGGDFLGTKKAPDAGFGIGGELNYSFTNNLRAGVSLNYLRNDFKSTKVGGVNLFANSLNQAVVLANAYFDLAGPDSPLVPYVGAGVGYDSISTSENFSGIAFSNDSSTGAFAYSAIAGLNYFVNETLSVGLAYRFIGASSDNHKLFTHYVGLGFDFHLS